MLLFVERAERGLEKHRHSPFVCAGPRPAGHRVLHHHSLRTGRISGRLSFVVSDYVIFPRSTSPGPQTHSTATPWSLTTSSATGPYKVQLHVLCPLQSFFNSWPFLFTVESRSHVHSTGCSRGEDNFTNSTGAMEQASRAQVTSHGYFPT